MAKFRVLFTEYTGPMCANYQNIFLQPIVEYTKDTSAEVRQAAIYGCGVIAQVKNLCKSFAIFIFISLFYKPFSLLVTNSL